MDKTTLALPSKGRTLVSLCLAVVVIIIVTSQLLGSIDDHSTSVRKPDHIHVHGLQTSASGPSGPSGPALAPSPQETGEDENRDDTRVSASNTVSPGPSGADLTFSERERTEPRDLSATKPCSFAARRQHLRNVCETNPPPRRNIGPAASSAANPKQLVLRTVVFDHERKTVGCFISKVGSTAWTKYAVVESRNEIPTKAITLYKGGISLSKLNENYANYTKYIIVRHPLQRLVSGYREAVVKRKHHGQLPIEEVMTNLASGEMVDIDAHWARYSSFCQTCDVNYDYILKMETLDVDLPRFNKAVGIRENATLPSLNRNNSYARRDKVTHEHTPLNYKYDDILIKLHKEHPVVFEKVAKLYGQDMDMFGYNWGPIRTSTCAYNNSTDSCC